MDGIQSQPAAEAPMGAWSPELTQPTGEEIQAQKPPVTEAEPFANLAPSPLLSSSEDVVSTMEAAPEAVEAPAPEVAATFEPEIEVEAAEPAPVEASVDAFAPAIAETADVTEDSEQSLADQITGEPAEEMPPLATASLINEIQEAPIELPEESSQPNPESVIDEVDDIYSRAQAIFEDMKRANEELAEETERQTKYYEELEAQEIANHDDYMKKIREESARQSAEENQRHSDEQTRIKEEREEILGDLRSRGQRIIEGQKNLARLARTELPN